MGCLANLAPVGMVQPKHPYTFHNNSGEGTTPFPVLKISSNSHRIITGLKLTRYSTGPKSLKSQIKPMPDVTYTSQSCIRLFHRFCLFSPGIDNAWYFHCVFFFLSLNTSIGYSLCWTKIFLVGTVVRNLMRERSEYLYVYYIKIMVGIFNFFPLTKKHEEKSKWDMRKPI